MAKVRELLKRFIVGAAAIPAFAKRPFRNELPETMIRGRTGDARYVPQQSVFTPTKSGIRIQMANRLDEITFRDYDRVRFYPVIRDGIRSIVAPAARSNVHFTCDRPEIAELAQLQIAPLIPGLIRNMIRGALEYGYHAVEIRWMPKFDVIASSGLQSGGAESTEKYYPFIWTISRFAHFSPHDCRILIDSVTGDFAGIRQMVPAKNRDISGSKCLLYTHDKEFDQHYGVPLTKAAVPFVDLAVSLFDSMAKYADLFAVPGMVGRYPQGRTSFADGNAMDNGQLMQEIIESIGAGQRMSLPSNQYDTGGNKWDLSFFAPVSTSEPFTGLLGMVNDQIRLAIGVNEMASSDSTKVGGLGDQGAEDKIGLFLQNIETYLDELKPQIDKILDQFRIYNFGHDAPPLRSYFEPVDMNVTKALLAAVVQILSSGQPIQDAQGDLIYPDWAKILQDKGIPVVSVSGKRLAQQLLDAANQQIGAARNPVGGEGGSAGEDLVKSLTVDPEKPDTKLTAQRTAAKLILGALAKYETAPKIRLKLENAVRTMFLQDIDKDGNPCNPGEECPHCGAMMEWDSYTETCNSCGKPWPKDAGKIKLAFDESQHPRNPDGTFKTKDQIEAENARSADPKLDNQVELLRAQHANSPQDVLEARLKGAQAAIKENGPEGLGVEGLRAQRANLLAMQSLLNERAESIQKTPAGSVKSMTKQEFKQSAKKIQDSGFTRGRLPNVAELDGDLYVVSINKDTKQVDLRPAQPHEIMPSIAAKLEQRGHEAYSSMMARSKKGEKVYAKPEEKAPDVYQGMSAEGFPFEEKRMSPHDIGVFPGMQYKRSEVSDSENQVSDALKGVEKYDQATAGPLTVWQRNDGSTYVMNGHHRRELAKRTGEASVPVRVFKEGDGVDFNTARALGALQNVRDGKGTALDAAFVIKDLGFSLDELKRAGVNLRSGVGRDAVSLMALDPEALQMVKDGVVPQAVAAGIADQGLDPMKQRLAIQKAGQGDLETRREGEIIGRKMRDSQALVKDDGSNNLFGDVVMDVPWAEAAQIENQVVSRLAKDERLYRALTRGRAVGDSMIDESAQTNAANTENMARRAIATTKSIQDAIDQQALEYAQNPNRSTLQRAIEHVLEIARAEGQRRLENGGVA